MLKILTDIQLGKRTSRNRIVFCAHRTNLAEDGKPSERLKAYYGERARGGCGMIIVGELSLHANDRPYEKMMEVYSDDTLSDLAVLVSRLHDEGALAFAQLNHRGFQSNGMVTRLPVWGPGSTADVVYGEVSQKMEIEEIEEILRAFRDGASRLKEAGFDGLEVSIGWESLLRQFLSPLTNFRNDGYGGDLAGRLRFPLEVLSAVRAAVGPDYPVGVELCLDEMFYGALTQEDSIGAAREMERLGLVDFYNTTVGTFYNTNLAHASMIQSAGLALDRVASLKQAVSLPVFAGNRIPDPALAESILSENKADVIGWIRPLICDPHIPRKLAEGRPEEILTCVYDNQACVGGTNRNKAVGCIQNPWAGNEGRRPKPGRAGAKTRKRVVVVGAGPAGLKAGCVAASEGHDVTVYERAEEPGGQLRLARLAPGRAEIGGVIENLLRAANRLGVSIATGREMTAESILEGNPDAVILATGSFPHPHPVPGEYGPPGVLNVWQVLQNVHPLGQSVLMIDEDGHHKALATAEFLADQGKRVDILTSELFVGLELAAIGDLYTVRQRLLQKGATFICDRVTLKIEGRKVTAADRFTEELVVYDSYDTIVLAMGNVSDDRLYRELKGRLPAVYRAGDCVAPRKIDSAIYEANQVALRIEL